MIWNPIKEFSLCMISDKKYQEIQNKGIIKMKKEIDKNQIIEKITLFFKKDKECCIIKSKFKVFCFYLKYQNSKDDMFLQYYYSNCYIPSKKKYLSSIVLWSIIIPEKLRGCGIGTKIFELLENKAKNEKKYLIVLMITSEKLLNLCKKRKYLPRPPFCMYWSPFKNTTNNF